LVAPRSPTTREKIQESFVREQQIDPKKYYPNDYDPHLLEEWPVGGDLVVPLDVLPDNLKDSMGDAWRLRKKNQQILDEQSRKEVSFSSRESGLPVAANCCLQVLASGYASQTIFVSIAFLARAIDGDLLLVATYGKQTCVASYGGGVNRYCAFCCEALQVMRSAGFWAGT
jgi:hypothetical protein